MTGDRWERLLVRREITVADSGVAIPKELPRGFAHIANSPRLPGAGAGEKSPPAAHQIA
jgi:hypothetical protein